MSDAPSGPQDESARDAAPDAAALAEKVARGARLFGELRPEDLRIATTPKDAVWRQDKVTLYRYRPLTEKRVRTPILITYGLIGRYTMADLQEDRSLIRNLLRMGCDLYVVDWGNPSRAERWLTLDDYVDGYLAECVQVIAEAHGADSVNLLGICEGGVLATCYAALHPASVHAMVLTITPIDFHADLHADLHAEPQDDRPGHGALNQWARSLSQEDVDRLIAAHGVLPGGFMGSVFDQLTPMRSMTKYNLELLDLVDDREAFLTFLRMEKWLADRPHHPGEAARQWLGDLYRDNKLVRGEFVLGGRPVDLASITCPVLNVVAEGDHIVPPQTSRALAGKVGTADYTEMKLPGGHIGLFVGSRSQAVLGPGIARWLAARD